MSTEEWNEWCPEGTGKCGHCNGSGCYYCDRKGSCPSCGGTGVNKGQHCGSCYNNRNEYDSPIFYVPPGSRTEANRRRKMKERRG
jgi:hypothetical protein